ncbi:MAG: sugar ABC transporter permease [Eubacteriales bacterium]
MNRKLDRKSYPMYLAIPALTFYTFFIIVPFGLSAVLSLTDWNITRMYEPVFRGLYNYFEIFSDATFIRAIQNTLIFALCSTTLKTIFGLLLALGLYKASKLNNVLRTIFYVPCVLSTLIIGVLFTSILAKSGLLNNLLESVGLASLTMNWLGYYGSALACVIFIEGWMWSGFNMFIFIAGMQAIPVDYYEFARIEGASAWNQFKNITIPLLMPSFTVTVTLGITGGLKVFDLIYVLTGGGPGYDTQVVSTYVYSSFGLGFLGESAAASVILSIIVVVISFSLNRFFTKREVEM